MYIIFTVTFKELYSKILAFIGRKYVSLLSTPNVFEHLFEM